MRDKLFGSYPVNAKFFGISSGVVISIFCTVGSSGALGPVDPPPPQVMIKSDNTMIRSQLNWNPKFSLYQGLEQTYKWIFEEIKKTHNQ